MDCIVNEPDPVLKPFFDNFSDLWSRPNQAQAFGAYVRGLLSETHRKNIEAMNAKIVAQDYQCLHHFLSESPWDAQALNDRRIALLEGNRRTASCAKGVLILDDSGVPKKGQATEGVKRQYIGQLGKTANGQVFVTSHYADARCHWPVDIAPYVPDVWLEGGKQDPAFRTKIELALALADRAVERGLHFRAVVADVWYGRSKTFVKGLETRNLPFVVALDATQRIFARLKGDIGSNEHRLKEALSLLAPRDFRPVRLQNADGTEREAFVARLRVKIKGLVGKRRVVVVTSCPQEPSSDDELRFLLTNVVQLRDGMVARLYAWRNWVEVFYGEAKDELGADQYQVRDLSSIVRHWMLVFAAYSLLVKLRREGRLERWCKKNSTPSGRP